MVSWPVCLSMCCSSPEFWNYGVKCKTWQKVHLSTQDHQSFLVASNEIFITNPCKCQSWKCLLLSRSHAFTTAAWAQALSARSGTSDSCGAVLLKDYRELPLNLFWNPSKHRDKLPFTFFVNKIDGLNSFIIYWISKKEYCNKKSMDNLFGHNKWPIDTVRSCFWFLIWNVICSFFL